MSVGFNVCVFHCSSSISSSMVVFGVLVCLVFISSNCFLQFKESLHLTFDSSIRGWESRSILFSICFPVFFFGEGGGTSVGFVWTVAISRFFKSLILLVTFPLYVLDNFSLSLRIRNFPGFQSIKGLYSLNHGNPKMMSDDPMLLTSSLSRHFCPFISVWIQVKCVIFPAWFSVPSMFHGVIGHCNFWRIILCLFTYFWFINIPPAPVSRRMFVSMILFPISVLLLMGRLIVNNVFPIFATSTEDKTV